MPNKKKPESKPTPEERAETLYRKYMARQKSDVPLSTVKDDIIVDLTQEIEEGKALDDPKSRATRAFKTVDSHERKRANESLRDGQGAFDLGEQDLIVALAGVEEEEDGSQKYSYSDTARCRIGAFGLDEYLRWDYLQDKNRRDANEAYDQGKARFAAYLPYFQQGLSVPEIHKRGLLGDA